LDDEAPDANVTQTIRDYEQGRDAWFGGVRMLGTGLRVGMNVAAGLNPITSARLAINDPGDGNYVAGAPGAIPGPGAEGRALEETVKLGRAGEKAAGIVKNTEQIISATGRARFRVPDLLDHEAKIIGEVKNVGYQHLSSQIKDDIAYARANGYTFELW